MTQCAAKNRRGDPCKQPAINGTSKCRYHGGASLVGVASPTFKHGRYSKHLPSRLAERYGEALSDPQLLELRDEIALVGTRQGELLERLDNGLTPAKWFSAQAAYRDLVIAINQRDQEEYQAAIDRLGSALDATENEGAIWDEVIALSEQRRKLAESEQKRLVAMQQMITTEQAMALLARVTESIRKHVSDPSILAAVASDLRAIVNAGVGERT